MNPELSSSALSALPVRRRETLEIFDTALKLYRRYFWVLLGWSALVSSFALVPVLNWFSIFAMPLLYGAVSCCVAAAVRGQNVKFAQCWAFTKPRYGPLLGTILLSYLILFGVFIALYVASLLVGLLGALMLSNAPEPLQVVGAVVGGLLALIAFSVMGVVAFGWTNMVPIVVCLEDDKRSSAAMGRAFDLLRGNWRRVFGLSLILGLAIFAVFGIVGGIYLLFGFGSLSGLADPSGSAIWQLLATLGAFMGLFFLIWYPAQSLVIAVLYLDLRVRREALDLEWTAYASAPASAPAANSELLSMDSVGSTDAFYNRSPPPDAMSMPASFAAGKAESATQESPTPLQNESAFQAQEVQNEVQNDSPTSGAPSELQSDLQRGENEARRD